MHTITLTEHDFGFDMSASSAADQALDAAEQLGLTVVSSSTRALRDTFEIKLVFASLIDANLFAMGGTTRSLDDRSS